MGNAENFVTVRGFISETGYNLPVVGVMYGNLSLRSGLEGILEELGKAVASAKDVPAVLDGIEGVKRGIQALNDLERAFTQIYNWAKSEDYGPIRDQLSILVSLSERLAEDLKGKEAADVLLEYIHANCDCPTCTARRRRNEKPKV